jgi:hypothetical protein
LSTQRPPRESASALARRVREQFVAHLEAALAPMQQAIRARPAELGENTLNAKEMYELRDALVPLLGADVDVTCSEVLRPEVRDSALAEAIPL